MFFPSSLGSRFMISTFPKVSSEWPLHPPAPWKDTTVGIVGFLRASQSVSLTINPFQVELVRIMFSINPLENLKLYISSRPPLVVFMISVSAMAIAFLTLGYFFKIKEIKSPEMAEVSYILGSPLGLARPYTVGEHPWALHTPFFLT